MGARKRLNYLDRAKGLGILMITLGHILPLEEPLRTWMALFKISIFYVVSGWIVAMNPRFTEGPVGKRVKKLFFSLMWPYFTFSLLGALLRAWRKVLQERDVLKMVLYDVKMTFSFQGVGPLWFLPSLFLAQVLFFLMLKSRSRAAQAVCFVLPLALAPRMDHWYDLFPKESLQQAALLLPMKTLLALWFLQMGYWGFALFRRVKDRRLLGLLGGGMILGTLALVPISPVINMNYLKLGNPPWVFFLGGVLGSFGFLLLFQALEGVLREPLLPYWGRYSIVLMGTQRGMTILNYAIFGMEGYAQIHDHPCLEYYLEMLTILVVVLLIVYALTELMERYAPFITRFPGK